MQPHTLNPKATVRIQQPGLLGRSKQPLNNAPLVVEPLPRWIRPGQLSNFSQLGHIIDLLIEFQIAVFRELDRVLQMTPAFRTTRIEESEKDQVLTMTAEAMTNGTQ